jgi:hypothetical protein
MSAHDSENYLAPRSTRLRSGALVLLFLGLAVALAANVYQFVKGEHLGRDVALMQRSLQAQITRLSDATSGGFEVTQQRFQNMKDLQDSTASELRDARSELKRTNSEVAERLEEKNHELMQRNRELVAQLAALKQETSAKLRDATAKLQNTSARLQTTDVKLDKTNAKLDRVSTDVDRNTADLKRVAGNVSAIAIRPPATVKRTVPVREPQERTVLEFDLLKTKVPTRVGEIQIAIRSADPKKNLYTMDVYAGDSTIQVREAAVNERVQMYMPGGQIPYEIVVRQVRKDEVLGYVAAPQSIDAKTQTAAATLAGGALASPRR